jgi:uncharacterized membrane protein HdeD (DUF308 family)
MAELENAAGGGPPPPPRPIEYRDLDDSGWWLAMLGGVALVVVGLWMLSNLFESVVVLAILVGASLIVGGVVEVAALGGSGGIGWPAWLAGAFLVVAGAAVIAWPGVTLWAITVVAGAGLLLTGALRVVDALYHREDGRISTAKLGLGGLGIALALVILAWPEATVVVLAVILGLRAIASGLVAIGLSWRVHRLAS